MSRVVSFFVLLVAVGVAAFFFYRVMAAFLLPLFLAVLAVVIFQPVFRWMIARLDGRRRLAGWLTTAIVLCAVLLPIGAIVTTATIQGVHIITRLDAETLRTKADRLRDRLPILQMPEAESFHAFERELERVLSVDERLSSVRDDDEAETRRALVAPLQRQLESLEEVAHLTPESTKLFEELRQQLESLADSNDAKLGSLEFDAAIQVVAAKYREMKVAILGGPLLASIKDLANPTDEDLRQLSGQIFQSARSWLFRLGSQTTLFIGRLILGTVIMVVAMYFFFVDGPAMVQTVMRLSPMDDEHEKLLLAEFDSVNRAVVLASLLSALAQGALAGIAYWFLGLPAAMMLTVLTAALAMLPFVGTSLVWVPASLYLYFYEERTAAAVFLFLYGALVVSLVDNLIKPWVLHGRSKLHPLLALLSVLGGVQALGPIGIVAGPMAAAFLQTLLNLLHREIMALDTGAGPMAVAPSRKEEGSIGESLSHGTSDAGG